MKASNVATATVVKPTTTAKPVAAKPIAKTPVEKLRQANNTPSKKRKLLTAAQRSAIARAAAFKAHNHPTFMKLHARAAKKADVTLSAYMKEMRAARPAQYRKI